MDNAIVVAVKEGHMLLKDGKAFGVVTWGSTWIFHVNCLQCPWYICSVTTK
jgi:hypothetical protein